jgi:putative addiction module component (TIGR02574 family)
MNKVSLADVLEMNVADRILFVEDVWDTIAASPESVPLTEAQREELDRRLEAYERNPDEGESWNEVKTRLLDEA